jgi:hypothetical protein
VTERARDRSLLASGWSHRAAWLAWSVWLLSLPLTASSGVLAFLSAPTRSWDVSFTLFLFPLLAMMFVSVGAFVASRRPGNPIGWIFCAEGLPLSIAVSASAYATYALYASPGPLPGVEYAAWLAGWLPLPTLFLAATLLFLLFPDGRVLSPEWNFVAGVALIGCVMAAVGEALGRPEAISTDYGTTIANPVAIGGGVGNFLRTLGGIGLLLLAISCLAAITSSFARWVWARGQERQQLKWFAYAAATMIGGFLSAVTIGNTVEFMWDVGNLVGILGFAFLPIATAIAILKYRLYDIDRVINRTLVYGLLTAILAGVYFGGVTLTQALLRTLTDQQELPQLVIVASTLVIAALFTPLRRSIQSIIDRSFYRRKYDAAKTLEAFSKKLRDETDLEALRGDLVGVVTETMQPAHVSLWLRPDTPLKGKRAN